MGYFSNGTEGLAYEERFCSRCVHSDTSGDREIGVDRPCPVWLAHTLYAYELCNEDDHAGKIMLDMLIPMTENGENLECVMFHPIDAGAAIEGQLNVLDLSNGERDE